MSYKNHHVLFLAPAWGHVTSAHALVVRELQLNPALVVTIVHHGSILSKATADIHRYPDLPKDRLSIVSVGVSAMDPRKGAEGMKIAMQEYITGFLDTLKTLTSEGQPWPKPTALVLDAYGPNMVLPTIKKIAGPDCKTYMHWTGCATTFYVFLAPSAASGFSDYAEIVDKYFNDEGLRKGRSREEILEAVCIAKNGTDSISGIVARVPGMKDMYDYEREASNGPTPPSLAIMLCQMSEEAFNTDGLIMASSHAIEGDVIEACKKYTTVYDVGLQLAPRGWNKGQAVLEDEALHGFLDQKSPNSVLYISFGSMFFPNTERGPRHLDILINTLLELKFPFLFALGGVHAQSGLSQEQLARINGSGVGLVSQSWVDQQAILQHPSTGWFLTHGGWNSIAESLVIGVPMMVWPLAQSDQATNAAMLSTRDKPLGFEFLQIRQGYARAPAMRGGPKITGEDEDVRKEFVDILGKARGPEGDAVRDNVKQMAGELRAERDGRGDDAIRKVASL